MKRLKKILLWSAGIFVLLLVLAAAGIKLFFPNEKVRLMAVEKGSQQLGREVTIKGLDISIWGGLGIQLEGVEIANLKEAGDQPFFKAESIDAKLRILPLLSSEYSIDRLIIESPIVNLRRINDSVTNYTFDAIDKKIPAEVAEKTTAETKAAAAAIAFDQLELRDAVINYVDQTKGNEIKLTGLNLSTSLTRPNESTYKSNGRLKIDKALIIMPDSFPVVSLGLDYSATYDISNGALTLDESSLDINSLRFTFKGAIDDLLGNQSGKGSIKSDRINVAELLSLMSAEQMKVLSDYQLEGGFDLDVDIDYDPTRENALTYTGTSHISDLKLAQKNRAGEFTFELATFDFKPDNLRMNIQRAFFDGKPFKGFLTVDDFNDPIINGELAGGINLALLNPFLPVEDEHVLSGDASADLKFSGRVSDYKRLDFSGTIGVARGEYNSKFLPEPMRQIELDMYLNNNVINVRRFSAQTGSGSFVFSGRSESLLAYFLADSVQARKIKPSFDGKLKGNLNLNLINRYLPPKGSPKLDGVLTADLSFSGVKGDYDNIKPYGTIEITNASYTDSLLPEPVKQFNAKMTITPDTIKVIDLTANFESSDFKFSGRLTRPFPYLLPIRSINREVMRKPKFNFELSSRRFDMDKLFPEAVPGAGEAGVAAAPDSISMMLLPDIDGGGTFAIDTLIYAKVEFANVTGKVKFRERVIECYDVNSDVYSGQARGKTTIDLNDLNLPHYVGSFKVIGIQSDDIISRFTEMGGHLFGKIDLEGNYDAYGWEPEEFQNSLNMTGTSNMKEGRVVTSGGMHTAFNGLAKAAGKSFDKEQVIKNMQTNIKIENGRVSLDDVKTELGDLGDMNISGFYGLLTGALDYSGDLTLSSKWSEDLMSQGGLLGGVSKLFNDKSVDRLKLPLKITGTMDNPKVRLEYESVLKEAGQNLLKSKSQSLFDKLKAKLKK